MAKTALGRGLSALLGGSDTPASAPGTATSPAPVAQSEGIGEAVEKVPLDRVRPCPFQPRKDFPDDNIHELADSIKSQGIVQPLVVRQQGEIYELIAGERRWRAAREAGLFEVPVIVREADDRTVLELALVENLQRENLNPIEEALGYAELARQFDLTQEAIAIKVGKSRATVTNAMRMLKLAPEAQNHLRNGRISAGHAKVILGLSAHEQQLLAVDRILRDGLNVRETEKLTSDLQAASGQESKKSGSGGSKTTFVRDAHITDMESKLQEHFGTKVLLRYRKGKGAVEIRFFSDEELERVLEVLGVKSDD
ncbi:MAG: ParB/RepB/Spo0J family partition protein [Limisphaerales bacterium]